MADNGMKTFHTDTFCDILALQTRNLAVEGGRNLLASSWTIYNKLKASRPDVVELLAQPIWPFDRYGPSVVRKPVAYLKLTTLPAAVASSNLAPAHCYTFTEGES